MTEAPTSTFPSFHVIPLSIYNHLGKVMIALNESELIPIMDPSSSMRTQVTGETTLLASRRSDEWVGRMINIRNALATDLRNERAALQELQTYVTNLGEAILETAIEHDWCEEYDEFARQWDLPQRTHEYEVTVTVRVTARNSDEAEEYVRNEIGISSYTEHVTDDPDFYVSEL